MARCNGQTLEESEAIVAYESDRLKRVGTREVTLGIYELSLTDEEQDNFAEDAADILTAILQQEGQVIKNVSVFPSDSPSAPIFFPEGPAPIVAHCESPAEVQSMWIVYMPSTTS
jgi:hypothetical protein